jgi:hypothetical protein
MTAMVAYLESVPNGTLLLIAVADEAGLNEFSSCAQLPYPWVTAALQQFETLGSTRLRDYCYQDQWALIAVKGQGALSESLATGAADASAIAVIDGP